MNLFRKAFPGLRHVVLPVIHVETCGQTLQNVEIACLNCAEGVFLINHSTSPEQLLEIANNVGQQFPHLWIGVNCLGVEPEKVFGMVSPRINGIWADNAEIDERQESQDKAEAVLRARMASKWPGLYFGGVAFKYQRHVEDLGRAAQIAADYMDVVTTSGPGTGQAAPRQKIATMKAAIEDYPLAIASGITPENVSEYLDVADCFLVATGVSRSFTEFEPARVKALMQAVRGCA
jgi:uncharacterized protein